MNAIADPPIRTRTVTWVDPEDVRKPVTEMAGVEWMRAIISGNAAPPPSAELLGVTLDEAEEGRVVFSLGPGEHLYNPMGTVHGGFISTLADFALTGAILSKLGPGELAVTLDLKLTFLRPATIASGRLTAAAEVVFLGGAVGASKCDVIDANGVLIATGTATCQVRRPKAA